METRVAVGLENIQAYSNLEQLFPIADVGRTIMETYQLVAQLLCRRMLALSSRL